MKVRTIVATAIAGASLTAAGIAFAQAKGGTAVYWMSAETASGLGAMMGGGQGGSAMAAAMMAGRDPGAGHAHRLTLQLGTGRSASSPNAEHLPPAALRAGPSLPLVTPVRTPSAPTATWNGPMEKPKGKMLIYWGCGEHAGPGQPVVLDFAKLAAGQVPPELGSINVQTMNPPAPGRNTTYGEWPNDRSQTTVPAGASLVGEHVVRGNYTPEIKFALAQGQDFLAPLAVRNAAAPSGAVNLNWPLVPRALGYFAGAMGAAQDGTMVVWSSSAVRMPGMALPDYLSEAEISRLVGQKVLMGPQATQCTIPVEAAQAMPNGMLMMNAYGPEANFSYPPRPANAKNWNPEWTVKLRTKSTHMAVLGMDMSAFGASEDTPARQQPQAPQRRKKRSILDGLGSIPIP
jgi:hypothetical protein